MDEQQIRDELAAARTARFASAEVAQKKKELYEVFYRSINEEKLLATTCPEEEAETHVLNVLSATAAAESLEAELALLVPGWTRPDGAILGIAPSFTPEIAGIAKDRQKLLAEGMDTIVSGGYFHFHNESDPESSTVDKNFKQKVRLACSISLPGEYKLEWYYEWGRTGSANSFEARIQLNDSPTLMAHKEDSKTSDLGEVSAISGFKVVKLTTGLQNFDLDYRNTGKGSAKILNARLFLSKML